MTPGDWAVVCALAVFAVAAVLGWIAFYRATGDDFDDIYNDMSHWGDQ